MNNNIKHLAIVVCDDGYDRLYTPLNFALLAAKQGAQVDILFTLWAVRVLTEQGASAVCMHRHDASDEATFGEALRRDGVPAEIVTLIRAVKQTGNVHLYGCQLAARTFGVSQTQLLPEADGIVNAMWFLNEKALAADHCQYF
jgi:peroxiredoxin family protein